MNTTETEKNIRFEDTCTVWNIHRKWIRVNFNENNINESSLVVGG